MRGTGNIIFTPLGEASQSYDVTWRAKKNDVSEDPTKTNIVIYDDLWVPRFGGIKQCKHAVIWRDFRYHTAYLWTPKPWKMKVLGPQYMGHNPQKWRYFGFPWYHLQIWIVSVGNIVTPCAWRLVVQNPPDDALGLRVLEVCLSFPWTPYIIASSWMSFPIGIHGTGIFTYIFLSFLWFSCS